MNSGEICHYAKIFMGAGEEKIAEMIQQEQEQARQKQSKQEQARQERARQEQAKQEQAWQEQAWQVRCWIKQACFGRLAPMGIMQTSEKTENSC